MKKLKLLCLIFLIFGVSCKNELPYGEPIIYPEVILKNDTTFFGYMRLYLNLTPDFTAIDMSGKEISKADFLLKLGTGDYLPLRLKSDSALYYKLYPISQEISQFTRFTLRGLGKVGYHHYLWEGLPLPDVHFEDMKGKVYNSQAMKGNIVLFDFWFIGCKPCVKEIPELNHLADSLKDKDMLFLAVAFDTKDSLKKFIEHTDFHFSVISDTAAILNKELGIRAYPTKVVVGRDGKVLKILDNQYHDWKNLYRVLENAIKEG